MLENKLFSAHYKYTINLSVFVVMCLCEFMELFPSLALAHTQEFNICAQSILRKAVGLQSSASASSQNRMCVCSLTHRRSLAHRQETVLTTWQEATVQSQRRACCYVNLESAPTEL